METECTIGIDLSDRWSEYCMIGADGRVTKRGRLPTSVAGFRKVLEGIPRSRVIIEVGAHSPWVNRTLQELGHVVYVANARRLRMIYDNDTKTDKVDAEMLARIGRMDPALLHPITHRHIETQADLAVLRARDSLVRTRTQLINHVRGAVKAFGNRISRCSSDAFHKHAADQVPVELRPALLPLLEALKTITARIQQMDGAIEKLGREKYPETARLRQVPGVGPITSLAYVLIIEDPSRFTKSRSLGAYLGLRPRESSSGARRQLLRITKSGDMDLRRLLVGAAHYILGPFGPPSDLRTWGLQLCQDDGRSGKKRAVVAVARKLAVLLHRLWVTGASYRPERAKCASA